MYMHKIFSAALAIYLTSLNLIAYAQSNQNHINNSGISVEITNPWVRATVANQKNSGGFLSIKSNQDLALVKIQADIAQKTELHTMKMENNSMYMYAVDKLNIPKNTTIKLTGDYHIMLFGLSTKLIPQNKVRIKLFFQDSNKKIITVNKDFIVKPLSYIEE